MAAAAESSTAGAGESPLSDVPSVVIDPSGVFKYIILELSLGGETKQVVRGNGEAEFHADIYDKETTALKTQKPGIKIEVRGGGRIRHEPAEKRVFVYGYSVSFGRAEHATATELIRAQFPDYVSVSWSNDGY